MSETKFTPGPWEVTDAFGPNPDGSGVSEPEKGVLVCSGTGYFGREGLKANLNLIAAAPEMYEELQECASLLAFLVRHLEGRMGEGALTDMHLKAESAFEVLAKARGEES